MSSRRAGTVAASDSGVGVACTVSADSATTFRIIARATYGATAGSVGSVFLFGLAALAAVFGRERFSRWGSVLSIVLAGVIVSAFSALVGLAQYVADPEWQLPGSSTGCSSAWPP